MVSQTTYGRWPQSFTKYNKYATGDGLAVRKNKPSPGFDFHCVKDKGEVYVEFKTFAAKGRVFVTYNEMETAIEFPDKYWLVGIWPASLRLDAKG